MNDSGKYILIGAVGLIAGIGGGLLGASLLLHANGAAMTTAQGAASATVQTAPSTTPQSGATTAQGTASAIDPVGAQAALAKLKQGMSSSSGQITEETSVAAVVKDVSGDSIDVYLTQADYTAGKTTSLPTQGASVEVSSQAKAVDLSAQTTPSASPNAAPALSAAPQPTLSPAMMSDLKPSDLVQLEYSGDIGAANFKLVRILKLGSVSGA